jgi:Tfp pilus assembly protein PilZ
LSAPDQNKIVVRFDSLEELESAFNEQIENGGYFVKSEEPFERHTPVEILFHIPGIKDPFSVFGEVAFSATKDSPMPGMGTGMAVQFTKLSEEIKRAFQAGITVAKTEGMDISADPDAGEEWDGDAEDPEEKEDEEDISEEDVENDNKKVKSFMARLNQQGGESLYFALRKLPMHHKIVAAKRGNRNVRTILLKEGNQKIVTYVLQNPQLSIPEVVQMLKMPGLSQELIGFISKNSSFNQSEEVKYHLVTHPKTPLPTSLKILNSLNTQSLAKLAKSFGVKAQIKSNAHKLLELRRKKS